MNRIKELRKEKNLTISKVSQDLNIPKTTLNNYENGKRSPRDQASWEKIANYFNVSVGYLMGINDQRVSDEYALKIAKEIYFDYLSNDNLSEYDRKALEYFNNENLDDVLQQAMGRYFSTPILSNDVEAQTLAKTNFLRFWLDGILIDKYQDEVKSNQNFINKNIYAIPDTEDLGSYTVLGDEIQFKIPLYELEGYAQLDNSLKELQIITYSYESAIDESLIDEVAAIFNDAKEKLLDLKQKHPDRESQIARTILGINDGKYWVYSNGEEKEDQLGLPNFIKEAVIDAVNSSVSEENS